jgi:hypothetical protein
MLALALLPLAVLGASCREADRAAGVATASPGNAESPATTAAPSEAERQLAYARCLREHGVEVRDPAPGESVKILGDKTPELRAAIEACRTLAPTTDSSTKLDPAQLLAYATCMRANGLPEFPDPDADGELLIPKPMLRLPAFEAAEALCAGQLGKPSGGTGQK